VDIGNWFFLLNIFLAFWYDPEKLDHEGESCGSKAGICILALRTFQFFGWHLLENQCKLAQMTCKDARKVQSEVLTNITKS